MRILIVNSLYPPNVIGGAEKSVALLAQALVGRGHRVMVLTLAPDADAPPEWQQNVIVERLKIRNLYWPFDKDRSQSGMQKLLWHLQDGYNTHYSRDFADLIDRFQPDVVHTNNLTGISTELWEVARQKHVRTVHTLRDYSLLCARAALFRDGKDCQRRCVSCAVLTRRKKQLSHHVDAVASNSLYVIDRHRSYGYFNDVPGQVIFNIADTPAVGDMPRQIVTDDLVFGFIGRIEAEKGIEVVLAATQLLPATGWRLGIAGQGRSEYVEQLKQAYPDPKIEWADFVRPEAFYASIDTTLIASVWPEPLPRTLIESFAYGRSVICSDAGGIPEIASMGPIALSYPRENPAALALAMRQAIKDRKIWQMACKPAAAAMNRFSEDEVAERYISLYLGR